MVIYLIYFRSAGTFKMSRTKSAPNRVPTSVDLAGSPSYSVCPVALRQGLLGEDQPTCKCSRHKIPYITDVEYDEYINNHAPDRQLIIIAVLSSL